MATFILQWSTSHYLVSALGFFLQTSWMKQQLKGNENEVLLVSLDMPSEILNPSSYNSKFKHAFVFNLWWIITYKLPCNVKPKLIRSTWIYFYRFIVYLTLGTVWADSTCIDISAQFMVRHEVVSTFELLLIIKQLIQTFGWRRTRKGGCALMCELLADMCSPYVEWPLILELQALIFTILSIYRAAD